MTTNDPTASMTPPTTPSQHGTRIEINLDAHDLTLLSHLLREAPANAVLLDIAEHVETWSKGSLDDEDLNDMAALAAKIKNESALRCPASNAERMALRERIARAATAAIERDRAGSQLSPTLREAVARIKERWVELKFMGRPVDAFTLSAAMLAAYVSGVNLGDTAIGTETVANTPEEAPPPLTHDEMSSSRKFEPMNIGGVFRCCADTLSDYLEKGGEPSKAGDTVQCKYAPDDSFHRLVFDGSTWRWCESEFVEGMPQTVVNDAHAKGN